MKTILLSFTICLLTGASIFSQSGSTLVKTELEPREIDRIVKKLSENEGMFRASFNSYAFKRFAAVYTIGMGGQISGVYKRDSFLTFDSTGKRYEKILYAPISTLKEISISAEDIENLGGIDPFALEPKSISAYAFTFVGKEAIDELNLYVFDVAPRISPDPKHGEGKYFSGRIWVDDRDLMIVRSKGKAIPEKKQRFATMESTRVNVDGKYWFPADVRSDDELVFGNGTVVKIRIRARYTDYNLGRSEVRLVSEEDAPAEPIPTPSPAATVKPKP